LSDSEYQELLRLREENKELKKQLQEIISANKDLQEKLDIIIAHMKKRNRKDFGQKSEKYNPRPALTVAPEILAETIALPSEETGKKKIRRPKHILTQNVETKIVEHKVKPEDIPCSLCSTDRTCIGSEITYQLERYSQSLKQLQHVQEVLACPKCKNNVIVAEKPCPPIPKGTAGPGLLAHTIVSKYADFSPLYRLERIYKREGATIPRSTLSDWILASSFTLTPLVDLMKKKLLLSKVVKTDDSPVKVQDREHKKKMRKGKMSVYIGDNKHPYNIFDFSPDQSFERNRKFLENFKGFVQADAAKGFDALFQDGSKIEIGCNAHARRGPFDCLELYPKQVDALLNIYGKIYDVEEEAKNKTAAEKLALRQTKAKPLFNELKEKLAEINKELTPNDPFAKAIAYTLRHWTALTRYLDDPDFDIDNNESERAIKDFVLGRKNYLFVGSDAGGTAAAVHLSLVVSSKRNNIDPLAYLTDVLTKINSLKTSQLEQLLPDNWAKAKAKEKSNQPANSRSP